MLGPMVQLLQQLASIVVEEVAVTHRPVIIDEECRRPPVVIHPTKKLTESSGQKTEIRRVRLCPPIILIFAQVKKKKDLLVCVPHSGRGSEKDPR